MEEILKQIVSELQLLRQDMSTVKQDVGSLKQDVSSLKQDMSAVKQDVSSLMEGQQRLEQDMQEVKALGKAMFEQVGALSEFRTEMAQFRLETSEGLDLITDALEEREQVTERLAVRSLKQESDIIALRRAK